MIGWIRSQRWWLGRVAVLPLHLLVFVIFSFVLVRAMPADPARAMLGQNFTEEGYLKMKKELGLDGSIWSQLGTYLNHLLHFDLGRSLFTNRTVTSELMVRLPATIEIALLALIGAVFFGLVISYFGSMYPTRLIGRVCRGYGAIAGAVPEYVLAVACIFVFYTIIHVVPAPIGRLSPDFATPPPVTGFPLLDSLLAGDVGAFWDMLLHLALPVFVMAISQAALLVKLLVEGLDEAFAVGPTRFRVSTGASRTTVLLSAYRRAAPAAVTMTGIMFGNVLGGTIIMESLFGLNGLGLYSVAAVTTGDFVALQGFLLVVAAVSILVFLLLDLLNMVLDPRKRSGIAGAS
ncbi:MAG TPA: ABC transporter permease [Kribbella sp.]